MKKYLSVIFTAIFVALSVFSTTSCSKNDSSTDANIVGTWQSVSIRGPMMGEDEGTMYFQFKENGTCVQVYLIYSYTEVTPGTWHLSNDTLTFGGQLAEDSDLPPIFTVTELTKKSMTLVYMGGLMTWEFKRVSDSEIEKYL